MAWIIVLILFVNECFCLTPQCRNENGDPVDWFYLYKLPKENNHINPLIRNGEGYMYITPASMKNGWIMSSKSINDTMSLVGRTLAPLYQNQLDDTVSLIYNDQPPLELGSDKLQNVDDNVKNRNRKRSSMKQRCKYFKLGERYDNYDLTEICKTRTSSKKLKESGHTKGVIVGDKSNGVWLVHSVPKFPPVPNAALNVTYHYPPTGLKFGQSMLCVSVQTSTLNQIATQLKYNEPEIVYYNLPESFKSELPNLVDVVLNKTVQAEPWYHIESFESLNGRKFLSFAKSGNFQDDLYSGLVAQHLQSDLLVESWINGPGVLDPECHRKYQVRNVEKLKFLKAKMAISSHNDHSKWAVTIQHKLSNRRDGLDSSWVCVGDINRALSQESRGGGTVCTSGPILWGNFVNLVDNAQTCNTN